MPTIDEIRQANLELLSAELGSRKALAAKLEISESQLSQWINGSKDSKTGKPRGMRLSTCHNIEDKTGKPRGWMDENHGEGLRHAVQFTLAKAAPKDDSPEALESAMVTLGKALEELTPEERGTAADLLSGWARDGGADRHIRMFFALVNLPPPSVERLQTKMGKPRPIRQPVEEALSAAWRDAKVITDLAREVRTARTHEKFEDAVQEIMFVVPKNRALLPDVLLAHLGSNMNPDDYLAVRAVLDHQWDVKPEHVNAPLKSPEKP